MERSSMVPRGATSTRAIAPRSSNGRDTPTRELVSNALSDAANVVRAEVKLVGIEMRENAKKLALAVPIGAAGGFIGTVGAVFLMWGVMLALALVLPAWAAALIVGGAAVLTAVALMLVVRRRVGNGNALKPERSLDMMAENRQWMREKLS